MAGLTGSPEAHLVKLGDNNACFGIGVVHYNWSSRATDYHTPASRAPQCTKLQSIENSLTPDGIDARSGQTLEEPIQ
jgi:hypothetical protein